MNKFLNALIIICDTIRWRMNCILSGGFAESTNRVKRQKTLIFNRKNSMLNHLYPYSYYVEPPTLYVLAFILKPV